MTRFALLFLLPSLLPACSDEPGTLDPSTTTGGASSSDASTGDGTTREGSSTSGESGSSGSSESGDLTTGGGTTSSGGHVDATSTGIVATTGGETTTGEGMTSAASTGEPDAVCWASHCDAETPCPAPLKCELHPDAVGLFVCTASCDECATGLLLCDSQVPQGECKEGNDMGKRCFPILCAVPEDCDFGEDCVDGFCT